MDTVKVNFGKKLGKIKPMNAVNNGPVGSLRGVGNFENYEALRVPYARLHDSAFCSYYGGEYSVDVHRIFPDFDADEDDPKAYVFEPTDNYLKDIESVGTKVYYRLGATIEHRRKRGTYPPKDYLKWARICEHIIRHYTEGWANGYTMDIEYWEIWAEPDCHNADGTSPTWQGTRKEFIDFFATVCRYLKEKFPHLKIGGPAYSWVFDKEFLLEFLGEMKKRSVPMDFFSFHFYGRTVEYFKETLDYVDGLMKTYGLEDCELHLNEWNYIKGWSGDLWLYSLRKEKEKKGAAFAAALMAVGQKSNLDMLMYYDARPCEMNGLFSQDDHKPLKPYYTFKAYAELARLIRCVDTQSEGDLYSLAASNGEEGAVMIASYNDDDDLPTKDVWIEFSGVQLGECVKVEFYALDGERNLELTKEEYFTSERFKVMLKQENQSVYFMKLKKAELI